MFDNETKKTIHIKIQKNLSRELRRSRWWQSIVVNTKCYYCQITIANQEVTMDHVLPVSRGGLSKKGNVVPSCKPCNSNKKDLTAAEIILDQLY